MKKLILLILFFPQWLLAQTEAFVLSEEIICRGETLFIENLLPPNASTYHWNFCINNTTVEYDIENLGSINNTLSTPTFFTIQKDGEQYFGLGTNYSKGLVRLRFDENLSTIESAELLGTFDIIPPSIEGISVHKENGIWWAFIVAGDTEAPSLIRMRFGNSLENIPSVENLGNIGELSWPHELMIFQEQDEWFGYTINRETNTLTRFSFGDNLSNAPTGENLGNVGSLDAPVGFTSYAENGEWYLLVSNSHTHNISILNFGDALSNDPIYSGSIYSNLFDKPRDIMLYRNCIGLVGLVLNQETSEVTFLTFQNNLDAFPSSFNLGNTGEFDFIHAFSNLVRVENNLHFFVTSVYNNSLVKASLNGCTFATPASSDNHTPPPIVYSAPGEYIIELVVDEGLPTQQNFCKEILVLPSPDLNLGADTVICKDEQLVLETDYVQTVWQDESSGFNFTVNQTGTYTAEAWEEECVSYDSIYIEFESCNECLLFPNAFTPDGDGVNDVFNPIIKCDPNIIAFELSIYNRWGELVFQSKDIAQGWDGTYKNHLQLEGLFIWQVRFTYTDQNEVIEETKYGELTLLGSSTRH